MHTHTETNIYTNIQTATIDVDDLCERMHDELGQRVIDTAVRQWRALQACVKAKAASLNAVAD